MVSGPNTFGNNGVSPTSQVSGGTMTPKNGEPQDILDLYNIDKACYHEVENKIKAVDDEIKTLTSQLNKIPAGTKEYSELSVRLEKMKDIQQKRFEMADYEIAPTGKSVKFTMKRDVGVEDFKNTFFIGDGAFRDVLKKEYQNGTDNGVFVETFSRFFHLSNGTKFNYTKAILRAGQVYEVQGHKLENLPEK